MTALFEAKLPPAVRLEMMPKDPRLRFAESRAGAKKHAVHANQHTVSAVTSQPQPPSAPIPSTTLMLQHEEPPRSIASSIASLQEHERTRFTLTPVPSHRTKRPASPDPQVEPDKRAPGKSSNKTSSKRRKLEEANIDNPSSCLYPRCSSQWRDRPTSQCRILQEDEKRWGILSLRAGEKLKMPRLLWLPEVWDRRNPVSTSSTRSCEIHQESPRRGLRCGRIFAR